MMAAAPEEEPMVRGPRRSLLAWGVLLLGCALLANAAVLLLRPNQNVADWLSQQARAQSDGPRMLGARGLYMSPMQLAPQQFGLCVMDVEAQTFAIYRVLPEPPRLRLIGVRSFRDDLLLNVLNNDPPTPHDVELLVQRQRERLKIENAAPAAGAEPPDSGAQDSRPPESGAAGTRP
jgi:hypothetical protein